MAFSINDLNYEKDSKERMPWEHYTEEFGKADPAEIAGRLSIPYDEEKKRTDFEVSGNGLSYFLAGFSGNSRRR